MKTCKGCRFLNSDGGSNCIMLNKPESYLNGKEIHNNCPIEKKEHENAIFQMGEAWRENKMNFPIKLENLGDLMPQERDEAIFRLGAEYGARAMAERFMKDLDASMKVKESERK